MARNDEVAAKAAGKWKRHTNSPAMAPTSAVELGAIAIKIHTSDSDHPALTTGDDGDGPRNEQKPGRPAEMTATERAFWSAPSIGRDSSESPAKPGVGALAVYFGLNFAMYVVTATVATFCMWVGIEASLSVADGYAGMAASFFAGTPLFILLAFGGYKGTKQALEATYKSRYDFDITSYSAVFFKKLSVLTALVFNFCGFTMIVFVITLVFGYFGGAVAPMRVALEDNLDVSGNVRNTGMWLTYMPPGAGVSDVTDDMVVSTYTSMTYRYGSLCTPVTGITSPTDNDPTPAPPAAAS